MVLPLVMAAATTALSFAGGIFGQQSAKKQARLQAIENARVNAANEARVHATNVANENLGYRMLLEAEAFEKTDFMGRLVAGAEANGFNPLTVLRAGGLSAYFAQGQGALQGKIAGLQQQSPQTFQESATQIPKIPSIGEVVTGALSDGLSAFSSATDKLATQAFQKELLGMQINAIQQTGKGLNSRTLGQPGFSTSGSAVTSSGTAALSAKSNTPNLPSLVGSPTDWWGSQYQAPDREDTKATSPWLRPKVDLTVPDAAAMEDRYGEVGEFLGGALNLADDFWFNVTGKTSTQRYEAYGKPVLNWFRNSGLAWGGADLAPGANRAR